MTDSLSIRDLVVERGAGPVVRELSIEVAPGEVTALLGPNGAGKSSLVLAVGGVLPSTAGTISIGDRQLQRFRPERIRAEGVAVVPEGRRLLPALTVDENLQVACYTLSRKEARQGRARALELFPELAKRLSVSSRLLSGGEQQMLVLAQALVSGPKFVLIDELSLGLAPVVVKRLVPAIRVVAESGVGVLLIEQFAPVALSVSNAAYVMERGRIHYSGTAAELTSDPSPLESAYLVATASGPSASGSE